jgi:hypothetical protein
MTRFLVSTLSRGGAWGPASGFGTEMCAQSDDYHEEKISQLTEHPTSSVSRYLARTSCPCARFAVKCLEQKWLVGSLIGQPEPPLLFVIPQVVYFLCLVGIDSIRGNQVAGIDGSVVAQSERPVFTLG